MDYKFLANDLGEIINRFYGNPLNSDWQNKNYSKPSGKGKPISHDQVGCIACTSKLPLILNGYDDEPVCSVKGNAAKRFWYMGTDHISPKLRDIVRLGFFFHCDIFTTTLLALKCEWERYLAKVRGYTVNGKDSFQGKFVDEPDQVELRGFNPDIEAIQKLICEHYEMVSGKEQTPEVSTELDKLNKLHYNDYIDPDEKKRGDKIKTLANQMIRSQLQLRSMESAAFKGLVSKWIDELKQLKLGNEKQQEMFWINKCTWLEVIASVKDFLFSEQEARINNERIRIKFLNIFGEEYLELEEVIFQIRTLKRRIEILEVNPKMSEEELEQTLKEYEEKDREEFEKLKFDVKLAPSIDIPPPDGDIDPKELVDYMQKIKEVMFQLRMLLHPDRWRFIPEYKNATDDEKKRLKELWVKTQDENKFIKDLQRRSMEIKQSDLQYAEGTVGAQMLSLARLMDILATVKKILKHAGMDVNTEYIIEGETILDKIEWLEKEIKILKEDIKNIQNELIRIKGDKETLRQKQVVECESEHEKVKKDMMEQVEKYMQEKAELEERFEKINIQRKEAA